MSTSYEVFYCPRCGQMYFGEARDDGSDTWRLDDEFAYVPKLCNECLKEGESDS